MADAVEKLFQVNIHDLAVALLNVALGLGDCLVGRPSWPKTITEHGKRRVPSPLQSLEYCLLDQPVSDTGESPASVSPHFQALVSRPV